MGGKIEPASVVGLGVGYGGERSHSRDCTRYCDRLQRGQPREVRMIRRSSPRSRYTVVWVLVQSSVSRLSQGLIPVPCRYSPVFESIQGMRCRDLIKRRDCGGRTISIRESRPRVSHDLLVDLTSLAGSPEGTLKCGASATGTLEVERLSQDSGVRSLIEVQ